jgi:hypothetical protein
MSNFLQCDLKTKNTIRKNGITEPSILKLGPNTAINRIINIMVLMQMAPIMLIILLGVFWNTVYRNNNMPINGNNIKGCKTDRGFAFPFSYNSVIA